MPSRLNVLKPSQREGDRVGAGPQIDDLVVALAVGDDASALFQSARGWRLPPSRPASPRPTNPSRCPRCRSARTKRQEPAREAPAPSNFFDTGRSIETAERLIFGRQTERNPRFLRYFPGVRGGRMRAGRILWLFAPRDACSVHPSVCPGAIQKLLYEGRAPDHRRRQPRGRTLGVRGRGTWPVHHRWRKGEPKRLRPRVGPDREDRHPFVDACNHTAQNMKDVTDAALKDGLPAWDLAGKQFYTRDNIIDHLNRAGRGRRLHEHGLRLTWGSRCAMIRRPARP